jgi:16S rRNA (uracil1498-N3)-methyltransferase
MSDRFYSAVRITTERVILDGPEAHHLLHVMRATVGDAVTLFDNSGVEFSAVIDNLGRTTVDLRIIERLEIDRELHFLLTVGVALPKGDRQKWLVEKLTELGVTTLVPLATTRGVAQPTDSALKKLERSVIEASKQCGRNRLMQIVESQAWNQWISAPIAGGAQHVVVGPPESRRLLAHPGGAPLSNLNYSAPLPTYLAIGPEGGLTDAEVTAAECAGWQTVNLGRRILRVETAVVALTAAVVLR